MLDFRFLTKDQCEGENKLDMFKKRGRKAAVTDYAILLGVSYSNNNYYKESGLLEDRTGYYWTKTVDKDGNVFIVMPHDEVSCGIGWIRYYGARPVMDYSTIKDFCKNEKVAKDGILEVEFGEYPQKVVSKELQEELEEYRKKLGSFSSPIAFTRDYMDLDDNANGFEPEFLLPREYKGKKYVLVRTPRDLLNNIEVSTGDKYKSNDKVWVEILPVKWLVDEKEDIAVSEKILFSGVQFNNEKEYDGEFQNTDLKKYLDERFSNEITAYLEVKPESIVYDVQEEFKNAYEFDFEKVTEEDLIRGSLESNIAPFLHGKSSEGKSARIKEFDPDAEIVYLRNATPDSLNGKSVYNAEKNEMIDVPPTWYVKLKEKCEKEPDKLHIVFFDELTNALPSIQGMAFNIILDKEINGKWKLPENARVAAAGNDLEDSLAANSMAEPLFNRFNHVYINTTVEDWLKWALTPNNSYERLDYTKKDTSKELKIHPAIYAFIASKKEKVLRTRYNGVKPNADPRKWEMASKVLYQTNNPYMLKGLIGEELTNEFVFFCQTKVISLEDVINGNYNNSIFEINSSKSYLTALALSNVDEENLEVVRNFIEKLGKEYLALFDFLWTIGDDERLERLMSLKQGKVKVKK